MYVVWCVPPLREGGVAPTWGYDAGLKERTSGCAGSVFWEINPSSVFHRQSSLRLHFIAISYIGDPDVTRNCPAIGQPLGFPAPHRLEAWRWVASMWGLPPAQCNQVSVSISLRSPTIGWLNKVHEMYHQNKPTIGLTQKLSIYSAHRKHSSI